jgi:hypothetical protein
MNRIFLILLIIMASGCTTSPPSDVSNVCSMFKEKDGWYEAADDSRDRWGSPIPVMMAIMHQESRFRATAKPPRTKILWVIPGPRPSSSYGYTQALEATWETYIRDAGNYGADRDDFADSIDFVGWYNHQSYRRAGIKKDDAYHLYLAYHEGWGGFNKRSFRSKQWLKDVSKKVSRQAARYQKQLQACEADLDDGGWWFW